MFVTGRVHFYEKGDPEGMKDVMKSLAQAGVSRLILTNAAGSCNPDVKPGALVLITDHIGFTGASPLFNEKDNSRFVNMVDAYSPDLNKRLRNAAEEAGIGLRQGVYAWFCGPHFETPAEVRAARILGADVLGMSTVPEVILARYFGVECAAISVVTNAAAGMSSETLSHEHTLKSAIAARGDLNKLLTGFIENYPTDRGK